MTSLDIFDNFISTGMQKALKVIPNKVDKSILLTLQKPYFSLIWLHGLGDSSAGFLDFFQMPQSPVFKGGRVKLLHAPIRPVTINGGMTMPSWYDIREMSKSIPEEIRYNIDEVKESFQTLDKYVAEEINYWKESGIKENEQNILKRIFVGGFSQGCAVSLGYALTGPRQVSGVVGFSGMLFESFDLKNKEKTPMLVYHGSSDDVIPFGRTRQIYKRHLDHLSNFKFKEIKGLGHSVCEQQLAESTEWILNQLNTHKIDR